MKYNKVVIEMLLEKKWAQIGEVSEVEPAGSMSNEEPNGRQVYLFGWISDVGPCVWKSLGGSDLANDVVREVVTVGLEKLVDLKDGVFEMDFIRSGRSVPLRFRAVQWVV